jgi:hypothetical protein
MCVAIASFVIFVPAFALLEGSCHTWSIGRFFAGRAGIFVDLFLVLASMSFVALALSCCGRGKSRLLGVFFSIITIASVVAVFWTNP